MCLFVFWLSSQAIRALLTIPFSEEIAKLLVRGWLTESLPEGFEVLEDVDILLMFIMNDLTILVQFGLHFLDLYVEWCTKKDFSLVKHPTQLREPLVKLAEFFIALSIQVLQLGFCEVTDIFQVACLLLAHFLRLSNNRFDFKGSIFISCNEIVTSVLKNAHPT